MKDIIQSLPDRNLMRLALCYIQLGWAVIPLHTSSNGHCSCGNSNCTSVAKHPRTRSGSKDASQDAMQICDWWTRWPDANIGIATGKSSDLLVVDIDPRHGGDTSWQNWLGRNPITPTLTVRTGGNGEHLYFKCPSEKLTNRSGLLPGVDIRGEGGYVVAPGSVHASGTEYHWQGCFSSTAIAEFPERLHGLIQSGSKVIKLPGSKIPNGKRNDTLTSLAGLLRKHGMEEGGIKEALVGLNNNICNPPLPDKEVVTIAKSISRYEKLNHDNEEWLQLAPLPPLSESVPELPISLVPEVLQSWIGDVADRMQVPLEFIAAPVIVSLSSVIGRQLGVYPKQKDDWLVVPNLWGGVVARPGFFKSPAIAEAMKPLENLAKQARQEFEAGQVVAKAKDEVLKAKIEGLKETIKKSARKGNHHELDALQGELEAAIKEQDEINITEKRYKTNDATIEKLGCLLQENENGLLVLRDELYGWLKGLNKQGREGDQEFYLEAWNGYGSYTVDRIGRGTLHVPALSLSLFGGLQPGKLEAYVSQTLAGGKGDDGLLQRFQVLVYPETAKKWINIDRKPDSEAFHKVSQLFAKLGNIDLNAIGITSIKDQAVPGIRFDKEAQEVFNRWRANLEQRLRSKELDTPAFESHLAKFRSLVPSLALIFHLLEAFSNRSIKPDFIGQTSLDLAIGWAEFLEAHAKKVYSSAMNPGVKAAHALAKKIKAGAVKDKASLRSIYRHHWALLDTIDKLESAISVLEECEWVRVETMRVVSTTTDRIRVNPMLNTSGLLS